VNHLLLFCESCSQEDPSSWNGNSEGAKEDPDDMQQLRMTDDKKEDGLFVMTGLLDGKPSKHQRATRRCKVCTRESISYKVSQNLKKVSQLLKDHLY
jgi:hypothetical protein